MVVHPNSEIPYVSGTENIKLLGNCIVAFYQSDAYAFTFCKAYQKEDIESWIQEFFPWLGQQICFAYPIMD